MKENEFIRNFGWKEAKFYLNEAHDGATHTTFYYPKTIENITLNISELKRLVESWELVKDLYGIERAKQYADSPYTAPEVSEAVKQAIKDVESCQ